MAVRSEHLTPVRKRTLAVRKRGQALKQLRRMIAAGQDYYDYNLLAVVILLTCFGLIMLYSATAYKSMINSETQSTMSYFGKQALISIVALVIGFGVSRLDYHYLARFAASLYEVSLVLLFLTRFIGREVNGAKRWIYIGPISFQPAEMAKLAVILFIPVLIVKIGKYIEQWKSVFIILGFGGLTAGFTYLFTQNLSTATIIFGIVVALIFIAHPETAPFLKIGAAGGGVLAVLLAVLINMSGDGGSFRIQRIQTWLHPEAEAGDNGYQILQALYAIGSGGFFGKGLGNSTQKLGAIPEAQNDMIFSIICEELGVFGAAIVILLFVFMLYRLAMIAQNAPDLLGSLIVSGIFIHIALQVVLNIAVVTNSVPTTGITLPFVSYGGTSIVFLMVEMGLALSVSRQIRFR